MGWDLGVMEGLGLAGVVWIGRIGRTGRTGRTGRAGWTGSEEWWRMGLFAFGVSGRVMMADGGPHGLSRMVRATVASGQHCSHCCTKQCC
jgi:hypothetical protein